MASKLVELGLVGRLAVRAAARRLAGRREPEPDPVAFRRDLDALLRQAPAGLVREHRWVEMPAWEPPWVDSGVELDAGDQATILACGRVYVAKALDVWAPPSLQLWSRIGEKGWIESATRDSHSVTAQHRGRLYFGNYLPNDWVSREGATLHGPEVFRGAQGGMTILVIVWNAAAADGLRALLRCGDVNGALAGELDRLQLGRTAPTGWSYLWHLGEAEIFQPLTDEERSAVDCHTHGDAAILQRDVDLPLTPQTRIAWRWKVDELPSRLREDTTPTHDYLSLAVEFDDGRDLSYYWSARLPTERFYACPLENWKDKETHLVVRSGSDELGRWLREDRNLYEDYRRAIGDPPTRIVRVWFIAVSLFQRGTGRCQYADIALSNENETVTVL